MKKIVLGLLTVIVSPAIVAGVLVSLYRAGFVSGVDLIKDVGDWIEG